MSTPRTDEERCETCNSELSECGEQNVDGTPSMDCSLCRARDRIAQLERELSAAKSALEKAQKVILETPHRINKAEIVGEWNAADINPSAIRNEQNARKRFFEKHKDALFAINVILNPQ